jgi:CRP-like cAMP-binding protein
MREKISNNILRTLGVKDESKGSFLGDKSNNEAKSQEGDVPVTSDSNKVKYIRDLENGNYFGEISLITHLKRTATIKAKDFTTLGYMMARNF